MQMFLNVVVANAHFSLVAEQLRQMRTHFKGTHKNVPSLSLVLQMRTIELDPSKFIQSCCCSDLTFHYQTKHHKTSLNLYYLLCALTKLL